MSRVLYVWVVTRNSNGMFVGVFGSKASAEKVRSECEAGSAKLGYNETYSAECSPVFLED
jgi:hypothetical protein